MVNQILRDNNYPNKFIKPHTHIRMQTIKHKQPNKITPLPNKSISYISLPFNDQYEKIAAILKSFNFCALPIVKKSFNSVIKLGKDHTDK